MRETWRWYGPFDGITLPQITQTGAAGIVTSLHEIAYGEVWPQALIAERNAEIKAAGFTWDVVESLPIHERIKKGEGDLEPLFANYRQSMANLAAEGIKTICYNFMPVLDWTRTDLKSPVSGGGTCLRFSAPKMAAFELHMLGRDAARDDYSTDTIAAADVWFQASDEAMRADLLRSIMSGLPGAFDRYDIPQLREVLATYDGISRDDLRSNYKRFLQEVIPTAQELGMNFCVHPDDPPRDILGLPRIVSNADDIAWIMDAFDAPENGLTLCSGSLGANPINDVPAIARRFGDRIHFAHLRNVAKDPDGSFEEAAHLGGDTDMVALVRELLNAQAKRGVTIPFRPDHGHDLLMDDQIETQPGYPIIGRLRGLAEMRGVIAALG
ncbi:mannonate dehydratase [Octadecabacter sp. 1_MG-2023]|uniref:mannonate dehydratase n=1 Tax=unclassified Octadecabacter TaxID=196158 RepID=UPI001C0A043D|nr:MULTISPECIES: mannonate dehydratase [unclassified Octadecabacter]MBU2993046.1 mannonate dehydratase [Octadecabacter sp. B2R22]MDO6733502.1 mannonate dehydratase [Octadecabacter sp. 1_MG-2023]